MKAIALAILFPFVFANGASAQTPTAETTTPKAVRVNVSSDTVSTFTEIPAGDYLIPDSQVFVGNIQPGGSASRWLGLLGVAIDTARSENAAGGTAPILRTKFDANLIETLKNVEQRKLVPGVSISVVGDPYDFKLLPWARVGIRDEQLAEVTLRLTVRIRDASGSEQTKNYQYSVGARPLTGDEGWVANGAEQFKNLTKAGFDRMIEVFALHAAGRLPDIDAAEKQRRVKMTFVRIGRTFDAIYLGETEHVFVVVPVFRDRPARALIALYDRESVRIEGQ